MGFLSKIMGVDAAQAGIKKGMHAQRQANLKARNALQAGAGQGRENLAAGFAGAKGAYGQGYEDQLAAMNQGYGQGMEFLQQGQQGAMASLDPMTAMFDPSMANQFSVEGIGQNLNQISDPSGAFSGVFDQRRKEATSMLGAGGYSRSGRAAGEAANISTDTALGINSMLFGQQMQNPALAAMNAQSQLQSQYGQNAAGMATNQGANMANIHGMNAQQMAALESGYGSDLASLNLGTAGNLANVYTGQGAADMAGYSNMGSLKMGMAGNLLEAGVGAAQAGATAAASDINLKKNVNKIGEHKGLGVYSWEWNDRAEKVLGLSGTSVGHIAQEVKDIHPELVHVMDNGYLAMQYNTDKTMSLGF